jgi:phage gp36-like protein
MSEPVYAQVSDFSAFGINENAIRGYDPTKVAKALAAASRDIDGYLDTQFTLPLLTWGDDIKRCCCVLAAWDIVSGRGYNPEAGADKNIKDRYDDRLKWLDKVSKGTVIPRVTDSTPGGTIGRPGARPLMVSSSQRGWSSRPNGTAPGGLPSSPSPSGPFTDSGVGPFEGD